MTNPDHASQMEDLIARVEAGDPLAKGQLIETQREYLLRVVDLRMEQPLRARVDPSDVVQDTMMLINKRMSEFIKRRPVPFRLWVRQLAIERLIQTRRLHLANKRSLRREVALSDASSIAVARRFMQLSPSKHVEYRELCDQVRRCMQSLSEPDREILLLRHVEELSNGEVAELLDLSKYAASKRYGRAIKRLTLQIDQCEF